MMISWNKGLSHSLALDEGSTFTTQDTVLLQPDANIGPVSVVMSTKVQQIASGQDGVIDTDATSGT